MYAARVHLLLIGAAARGGEIVLSLGGEVTGDAPDHVLVPFRVPPGTREIEVRHDDGSEVDILDWGLLGPGGAFRGWGGGNPEPAVVGEASASRSYVPGPIDPGEWSVVVGKAKIVSSSVSYDLEVVLRDAPTLAPQPERRPFVDPGALREGPGWFAGDFHVHSRESGDATATLDEIAALAVEQGLDFVVVTDHDTTTGSDFLSEAQARWPELLLVPGTEYTTYDGHATAYGATRWVDHKLGLGDLTIEDAVAAYVDDGVFFSLNHPALDLGDLCIGCAWALPIPDGVGGIEIATGGAEPAGQLFTPLVIERWEVLAAEGRLLTPLGGSDDHRAGQDTGPLGARIGEPVTMVWADELSIDAIRRGLVAGRTVVKLQDQHDPMVALAVDGVTATARVTGGAGGEAVFVVDGEEAARAALPSDDEAPSFEGRAGQRVRVEVWRDGARRTVTAFSRLTAPAPPPTDGEGCGCGGGGRGGVAAAGLAALWLRRRAR